MKLSLVCDFARGFEAERDEAKAKVEFLMVNRELHPFGYSIEVRSYAKDSYYPLTPKGKLASCTTLRWCCRLILADMGLTVRVLPPEVITGEFMTTRRNYRRAQVLRELGPNLDGTINRRLFL